MPTPAAALLRGGRCLVAPNLLQPAIAPAIPPVELVTDGILLVVILVVILRGPELTGLGDIDGDLVVESPRQFGPGLQRRLALCLGLPENLRSVGGAAIAELPVAIERVDVAPVHREQRLVAHYLRIVGDLHHLRMAGAAADHLLVARVPHVAAHESGDGGFDAVQLVVGRLHAPETAAREGGDRLCRGQRPGQHRAERQRQCECEDTVSHAEVLSSGNSSPSGTKRSARPLLHQRWPVGGGPSSKTWPWWPPQRMQWYSVRGRISLKSSLVSTRPSMGWVKLGQPVPLSNLSSLANSGR